MVEWRASYPLMPGILLGTARPCILLHRMDKDYPHPASTMLNRFPNKELHCQTLAVVAWSRKYALHSSGYCWSGKPTIRSILIFSSRYLSVSSSMIIRSILDSSGQSDSSMVLARGVLAGLITCLQRSGSDCLNKIARNQF